MKQKLFTLFLVLVASIGIASAQSGTCGTWRSASPPYHATAYDYV